MGGPFRRRRGGNKRSYRTVGSSFSSITGMAPDPPGFQMSRRAARMPGVDRLGTVTVTGYVDLLESSELAMLMIVRPLVASGENV